jgi:hypothetical protein
VLRRCTEDSTTEPKPCMSTCAQNASQENSGSQQQAFSSLGMVGNGFQTSKVGPQPEQAQSLPQYSSVLKCCASPRQLQRPPIWKLQSAARHSPTRQRPLGGYRFRVSRLEPASYLLELLLALSTSRRPGEDSTANSLTTPSSYQTPAACSGPAPSWHMAYR